MVRKLAYLALRAVLLAILLTYASVQLPVFHTKLVVLNSYKAIFIITPPGNDHTGATGFQIKTPKGPRIITNAHVCRELEWGVGEIHAFDGTSFASKIIRKSDSSDLCMLEGHEGYPSLKLGSSLRNFDRIQVLGHPRLGSLTPSEGVILTREYAKISGIEFDAQFTNAIIYMGNSGSPVFNFWGRVVGVMFGEDQYTHYGAFIPFDHLESFLLNRPMSPRPRDQSQHQSQSLHRNPLFLQDQ